MWDIAVVVSHLQALTVELMGFNPVGLTTLFQRAILKEGGGNL